LRHLKLSSEAMDCSRALDKLKTELLIDNFRANGYTKNDGLGVL
jgi:hypothetical protein